MEQNWIVGDMNSPSVVINCRVSGDRMPGIVELVKDEKKIGANEMPCRYFSCCFSLP